MKYIYVGNIFLIFFISKLINTTERYLLFDCKISIYQTNSNGAVSILQSCNISIKNTLNIKIMEKIPRREQPMFYHNTNLKILYRSKTGPT